MKKTWLGVLGIVAIVALSSSVWAHGMGGWGMMDDNDMPMMSGGTGCGGYGMGPGMMGGHGMGPGMMGGCGMGPGMMGGYGMGPGMMGGCGMSPGMMGSGAIGRLDLTADQRTKMTKIQDDLRKQHWALMGKMMDEQAKLRDLYGEEKLDAKKIGAVSDSIHALRKQMMESRIEAVNRMREALTKEQREQLNKWRQGGGGMMDPGAGHGSMMGR